MPSTADIQDYARGVAQTNGIDPALFLSMLNQESHFDPNAMSSAGAIGVGQLMPSTAQGLGVNPYDWKQNIEGSGKYYAQLLQQFGGDPVAATAAYNAGPGRVNDVLSGVRNLPSETSDYLSKVFGNLPKFGGSASDILGHAGSAILDATGVGSLLKGGKAVVDTGKATISWVQSLINFFSINTGIRLLAVVIGLILITAAVVVLAAGSKTVQGLAKTAALAA